MGEHGDFGRRYVLDPVMFARATPVTPTFALDVGCGEGRFTRMLAGAGFPVVGLDATAALIAHAASRDPAGTYVHGAGERLPFVDGSFDLVVSYLALIDMPDLELAVTELARVLRPGGTLLVANLTSFNTAAVGGGWVTDRAGRRLHFALDNYLKPRADWVAWRGIRVVNHHRPLRDYMQAFLRNGLVLTHFDEPEPRADAPERRAASYRRVPWFLVMEWMKPQPPRH